MTQFDNAREAPAPAADAAPDPVRRRTIVGTASFFVALGLLLVMGFLPTDYVVQQPGPVYDTIGTVTGEDDAEIPLIEVSGADTFDTSGDLFLTTVQVVGNREHRISWVELATAWFDPSRAIVPLDQVFPADLTTEQREQQNSALMTDSQGQAAAAALIELGYDVAPEIVVVDLPDGSPSEGVIEPGDVVVGADGSELRDVTDLRGIIDAADGDPVSIDIVREGEPMTVDVTPARSVIDGSEAWAVGISLSTTYELPIDVQIRLDDVGGPSAGMMFALGIIDVLTPEELTGGEHIAGTGTITATGEVGPIGGIRQKLYGAVDEGADWFLAPADNCDDVVGRIPDGLQVVSVSTLAEARAAVDAIAGGETSDLQECSGA